MKNIQVRFGRGGQATLNPLVPIIGYRHVFQVIPDAMHPHTLKYHQLIYVDEGELDIWVDGQVWNLSQGEVILIRPYEVMCYLKGNLPLGRRSFIQLDLSLLEDAKLAEQVWTGFKQFNPRIIKADESFKAPFQAILDEFKHKDQWSENAIAGQIKQLIYNLLRLHAGLRTSQQFPGDLLERIDVYINAHLSSQISIKLLAQIAGFSESHFRRQFLQLTGLQPLKYVNHRKLEQIKKQVIEGSKSLGKIAADFGFSSSQSFSSYFKKNTSFTPSEFRSAIKNLMQHKRAKPVSSAEAAAQLDYFFK